MEAHVGDPDDGLSGSHALTFGFPVAGVAYEKRLAAYAVIKSRTGTIAAVRALAGYWLPGGGALAGETPEETVVREVREELGRELRLVSKIGETIQYFFASADGKYYAMRAVFFRAELVDVPLGPGEYELCWLNASQPPPLFVHACHDWAVRRG